MKHVLIACDACGQVTPLRGIKNWWGLKETKGNCPNFNFTPVTKRNVDEVFGVVSRGVDMEKVAVAPAPVRMPGFMEMMIGNPWTTRPEPTEEDSDE